VEPESILMSGSFLWSGKSSQKNYINRCRSKGVRTSYVSGELVFTSLR
jgi:hypothetical protein